MKKALNITAFNVLQYLYPNEPAQFWKLVNYLIISEEARDKLTFIYNKTETQMALSYVNHDVAAKIDLDTNKAEVVIELMNVLRDNDAQTAFVKALIGDRTDLSILMTWAEYKP